MFEFIAYMPPNNILYEFNAPFVIKKDNDNYILYISKKPINYSFVYNNDVSNLLPNKIDKKSDIYNKIACAFNISQYNNVALNDIFATSNYNFYSYNGKYLEMINYNDCLMAVKFYAASIYKETFPDYKIFE
ncbi:hypothetical protein N5853_01440 [Bartonella sp. HY329]|uniref:hypothetical protein n=1 Tax=unclassified Bartonella TaxID=2645622 RepID=UPI0021C785C3|nr:MULTISPECIES: hypothetical protein [unclassified Bartonella]UXM95342.1 hypothetical protein N5853_01440 [Bartonella sp. HY329]UXN09667.1 hypothetical protein N5852_01445 [Bartonella sp. HY328]